MEVTKKYINKELALKRFNIETKCLRKLESNFECICFNTRHFPRIINSQRGVLTLSHCGTSLNNNFDFNLQHTFSFYEKQIDCILYNLKKNKIIHLDMSSSGKNLCISPEGIISVIDFDIVKLQNYDLSTKLKHTPIQKSMTNSNDETRYIKLKKKMHMIIKRKIFKNQE